MSQATKFLECLANVAKKLIEFINRTVLLQEYTLCLEQHTLSLQSFDLCILGSCHLSKFFALCL